MATRVFLVLLSVLLIALAALSEELPKVLSPNTTFFSATEVATLSQAIATLEGILNDDTYGCRRVFAEDGWQSHRFAQYSGGVLAEHGYPVKLVSGEGWPDGLHTWVLVGIPLSEKTAWIPVEASPQPGESQPILGRIPATTDPAGNPGFEGRYTQFSAASDPPFNLIPIARIRLPTSAVTVGERAKLLALGSRDPDGEIVLYLWDFGDGKKETSTTTLVRHEFTRSGRYSITLTVIDNQGKSATASGTLRVSGPTSETSPSSSDGCGCGG